MIALRIKKLPHGADLPLPRPMTAGSAGFDLYAAVEKMITIDPGARVLVPTGIAAAIPAGYEGQIRPRSGLALREGITLLNTPGTIDSDYRGEIKVILINLGQVPVTITRGDRIAQMVICPLAGEVTVAEVEELEQTYRGTGGFGHTG